MPTPPKPDHIRRKRHVAAIFAVATMACMSQPAAARQLEETRCTEIQAERDKLVAAGVRAQMQRGPAWARDNLPRDLLDRIAQLIDLDEQLMFRCPLKFSTSPLTPAKPESDGEGEKDGDDKEQRAETKPVGAGVGDATGTATTAPSQRGQRRPPLAPNGVPLPVRRPSGADGGAASPALRGSHGQSDTGSGLPSWANSDGRSR